ncbi:MAG TPA: DUF1559 domain-containing protein [Gemmatales bacterium]|nr:DUF1559 domain-containing protein [Gemmatales bacterium]
MSNQTAPSLPPNELPASPERSRLAIGSIILAIAACALALALIFHDVIYALVGLAPVLVWLGLQILTSLLAIVLGVVSLGRIKRRGLTGRTLALTGITVSILTTGVIMPLVLYARVLPTVMQGQRQSDSMRKLKRIIDAMHQYHDLHGRFPPAVVFNKDGKPLLSWRVLLLPQLGHAELYEKFKLDEAWDSPRNKPLLSQMPDVFTPLGESNRPKDFTTHFLVFDGPGAAYVTTGRPAWFDDEMNRARTPSFQIFPQRPGEQPIYNFGGRTSIFTIMDGPANTILIVEADERVPWSKPQDLPYDPNKPLPRLGGHYQGDFVIALADGAVRMVSKRVSERSIRDAITSNGGEVPQPDWLEPYR